MEARLASGSSSGAWRPTVVRYMARVKLTLYVMITARSGSQRIPLSPPRLNVASLGRPVKGKLRAEFVRQELTPYSGLEPLLCYLRHADLTFGAYPVGRAPALMCAPRATHYFQGLDPIASVTATSPATARQCSTSRPSPSQRWLNPSSIG